MKAVLIALAVCATIAAASNSTDTTWVQNGIHTKTGPGLLGQITDHHCGPHSLMQCIYKITGIDMKEATLGQWAGTTQSGTGHEGLQDALTKFNSQYNKKLKMSWYNFHDVTHEQLGKWMAGSNSCVFIHMLYRNTWGHYELPYKIMSDDNNYLYVANSLGTRKGEGYQGYIEHRTWADQKSYIAGISQKSVCVITA